MTLGRPQMSTMTLASLKDGNVARVEVVGTAAPLAFKQDGNGLTVTLPSDASHEFGVAIKIMGKDVV
jgi:alpha-L-fucosidase